MLLMVLQLTAFKTIYIGFKITQACQILSSFLSSGSNHDQYCRCFHQSTLHKQYDQSNIVLQNQRLQKNNLNSFCFTINNQFIVLKIICYILLILLRSRLLVPKLNKVTKYPLIHCIVDVEEFSLSEPQEKSNCTIDYVCLSLSGLEKFIQYMAKMISSRN